MDPAWRGQGRELTTPAHEGGAPGGCMHGYSVQQLPPELHPQRPPGYRAPDCFLVRGTLPPGPFAFQHPPWGTAQEPQDQGIYCFDQVTAVDGEFTLDNLAWHSCHSSYTRCVFRQTGASPPTRPRATAVRKGSLATARRPTRTAPSTTSTSACAAAGSTLGRRSIRAIVTAARCGRRVSRVCWSHGRDDHRCHG
jgi:hypothetical protein